MAKLAVPYLNGNINEHFGHSKEFKIYNIEEGKIVSSEVVQADGSGHAAIAGFMSASGVDAVMVSGIGEEAIDALVEFGIMIYVGISGNADEMVQALLDGRIRFSSGPSCDCSGHECGCGCGCHCDDEEDEDGDCSCGCGCGHCH